MTPPMTHEKEKLLERIKKCLMLGDHKRNNSPEEVATALNFAKRMMKQYNISLLEIQLDEMKEEEVVEGEGVVKRKFKYWEQYLSNVVAKFCSVGIFVRTSRNGWGRTVRQRVVFFGLKEDVEMAEQTYSILRKVILKMATNHGYKGTDSKSYCAGVVNTLSERVDNEEKMSEEEEKKCTAVMVIKNQIVKKYEETLDLKKGQSRSQNIDYSAYDHGKRDGHHVNLRPGRNQIE